MHVNGLRDTIIQSIRPEWFAVRLAEAGGFIQLAVTTGRMDLGSKTIEPGTLVLIHLSADPETHVPCFVIYTENGHAQALPVEMAHLFNILG